MKLRSIRTARKGAAGMTLVEVMVGVGIGSLVLATACGLWLFGIRCFTAMGNYAELDSKSRYAVDCMLRDMREATAVIGLERNGTNNWLQLTNSAVPGATITYAWDANSRALVCRKPGEPDQVFLTQCDAWDFQTYQRTPLTNGTYRFYPATNLLGVLDPSLCKLINMTWKSSRTILGSKVNTENVQTAQVVLRNKQ